jgi:CRP-like cAMP-binding protein
LKQNVLDHKFEIDGVKYEFYNGLYTKISNEIEEGSSFGELALLIKNGTRKATVKTSEPCLLLTLDYENFQ